MKTTLFVHLPLSLLLTFWSCSFVSCGNTDNNEDGIEEPLKFSDPYHPDTLANKLKRFRINPNDFNGSNRIRESLIYDFLIAYERQSIGEVLLTESIKEINKEWISASVAAFKQHIENNNSRIDVLTEPFRTYYHLIKKEGVSDKRYLWVNESTTLINLEVDINSYNKKIDAYQSIVSIIENKRNFRLEDFSTKVLKELNDIIVLNNFNLSIEIENLSLVKQYMDKYVKKKNLLEDFIICNDVGQCNYTCEQYNKSQASRSPASKLFHEKFCK